MHLDLQSIINYLTLGILVTFMVVTILSVATNKFRANKKKKEEEKALRQAPIQNYNSSQVYTFSVPENTSIQNPLKKTMERAPKKMERFQIVNDTFHKNNSSLVYRK